MARLFIGTYPGRGDPAGSGEGIWRLDLADDGTLREPVLLAVAPAPSFLAQAPGRSLLLAVGETVSDDGATPAGTLGLLTVGPGAASLVETQRVATGGDAPCHVLLDGDRVVVANYADGALLLARLADEIVDPVSLAAHLPGTSAVPDRQEGPHAHSAIALDGAGRRLMAVADLGSDRIRLLDAADPSRDIGGLDLPRGSGPRHFALHPSGRLYLTCELSAQVAIIDWDPSSERLELTGLLDASGAGRPASAPANPYDPRVANQPSHLALSTDASMLFVANRGPDTISAFAVMGGGERLEPAGEVACAAWPRHFAVVPGATDHIIVAGERADTVQSFRYGGPEILEPVDSAHIPAPACVLEAA